MSFFWFLFSILVCYGAYQMGIGTPGSPGPGFIPFLSAIVMLVASLSILILGIIKKIKTPGHEESPFSFQNIKGVFLISISLVAFMFLLNFLGFGLCTSLFMAFLLRIVAYQKWKTVIIGSFFTSLGAFLLFQLILKCQLPTGIIGF